MDTENLSRDHEKAQNLKRDLSSNGEASQVKKRRVSKNACSSGSLDDVSADLAESEYPASGLKLTLHGDLYQLKLLMLFLLRANRKGYSFLLATEMDEAEKFDDVVLNYKDERGVMVFRFLQAKHKLDETAHITMTDLLNEDDGDFSLLKYFISFLKILENPKFGGPKTVLKDFVLCTNIAIENKSLPYFEIITETDEILGTSYPTAKRMKLTRMDESIMEKVKVTLKNASNLNRLAKAIANCMLNKTPLTLRDELFRNYHRVLVTDVFHIPEVKRNDRNINTTQKPYATFSKTFLGGTDVKTGTQKLRNALVTVYSKFLKDTLNTNMLEKIQFARSQSFGKVFHLPVDTIIAADELDHFVEKFVQFICTAKDGLVNVQREKGRGQGVVKDNIDKLAGHVLVKKINAPKDIYHFSLAFTEQNATLPNNLDRFRDQVLGSLNNRSITVDLKELQFHIPNFLTCVQGEQLSNAVLPVDEISDQQIKDFLDKLTFAVEQPNEEKLEEIIRTELFEEFNFLDCKNVYCRFQRKVLKWMAERRGRFLSHRVVQAFFEKVRREILGAIWFEVREPVNSFTGRERQLTDLHAMIMRSDGKPTVISHATAVSGLGGIGKSELTRKYVQQYSEHFDDNVIWINAESTETMIDSFLKLAKDHRLGIPTKNRDGQEKSIEAIRTEVYEFFVRGKRRSLFIFDNAETFRSQSNQEVFKNASIERFLPLDSLPSNLVKPRFLITSRNQMWGDMNVLYLGTFTPVEAADFIKTALKLSENSTENEQVANLASILQYFPLALKQAVAYIFQTNEEVKTVCASAEYRVSDYVQEYEEMVEELLDFPFPEYINDAYSKTTFTTWQITFDKIAKMTQGSQVLEILNIAAYFAPEQIPNTVFLKLVGGNVRKLGALVQIGKQFSMIGVEEGMMDMHRLVQQVIRIKLKSRSADVETLRAALLLFKDSIAEKTVSHAVVAWDHASGHVALVREFSELPVDIISTLRIGIRLEEARLFGERTVKLLQDILGEDHRDVLEMRRALGRVLQDEAQYDGALCVYMEVYNKYRHLNGANHKHTLLARTDIAHILTRQGKYNDSLDLYRDVYSKLQAQFEPNHSTLLSVQSSIGATLKILGKYKEALEMYETVYKIRNDILGPTHEATIQARYGIAGVYQGQGKFQEAYHIYKEIYDRYLELNGSDHVSQYESLHEMASLLNNLSKYTEALVMHEKLIAIKIKLYGTHHPDTLASRNNMAVSLRHLGLYKDALDIYKDVHEKKIEVLGLNHPSTWITMNNMADILVLLGESEQALAWFKQVCIMRLNHLGPDHPSTLISRGNFALQLACAGKYDESIDIFKDILIKKLALLGKSHPSTLTTQHNIAYVLEEQEKYNEAFVIYNEVLAESMKSMGLDHEQTLSTQNNIATVLMHLGEYDRALELHRHVYARRQILLAPNNLHTLISKNNIACTLRKLGDYTEALQIHQECYSTLLEVYGAKHPDVLRTRIDITMVLAAQGKTEEALERYRELVPDLQNMLGEGHPYTIKTKKQIADLERVNMDTV